jgi:hypothetical protein
VKAERIRQDAARAIQQFKDELAKRSVKTLLANSAAPVSEAKLAANRANSQLSTGPVTPEGLAKSSQNARKHGLYSKQLVAPGEDPADLDALRASLFAEHQPQTETEALLITEMADSYWRLCRARRLEAALLTQDALTHLSAAQRMMTSAERAFYKALKTLTELRKVGMHPKTDTKNEAQESAKGERVDAKESGAVYAGVEVGLSATAISGGGAGHSGAGDGSTAAAAVSLAGPVPGTRAGRPETVREAT